jgi:hypothetical protein
MSVPSEAALCPETGTLDVANINVNTGNVGALGHGGHVAGGYGGHAGVGSHANVYGEGGAGGIHHAGAGHHEGVTRFALRWNDYQVRLLVNIFTPNRAVKLTLRILADVPDFAVDSLRDASIR